MRSTKQVGGRDAAEHINRTGMALAPTLSDELVEATSHTVPSEAGDAAAMAEVRQDYAKASDPVGTMPPPVAAGGPVKGITRATRTGQALMFMDKLGERMAFERSGVRLYDALLSKFDAFGSWTGGPGRDQLEQIRQEEREHFLLTRAMIAALGGDPSAVTPAANVHAVASRGLGDVLADPRTDLRECLEAILVAELVDNDGWGTLIDLGRGMGHEQQVPALEQALEEEREHLEKVRTWLAAGLGDAAAADRVTPGARPRQATVMTATQAPARAVGDRSKPAAGRARTAAGRKASAPKAKTKAPTTRAVVKAKPRKTGRSPSRR